MSIKQDIIDFVAARPDNDNLDEIMVDLIGSNTANHGQIAPWSIEDMQAKLEETKDSLGRMHQIMDRMKAE